MLATEPGIDHFASNIRYYLAKKQMEGLFLKWMTVPATTKLIQKLIEDIQKPEGTTVTFFLSIPVERSKSALSTQAASYSNISYSFSQKSAAKSKHSATISFSHRFQFKKS